VHLLVELEHVINCEVYLLGLHISDCILVDITPKPWFDDFNEVVLTPA